jgi:hypothetical protein
LSCKIELKAVVFLLCVGCSVKPLYDDYKVEGCSSCAGSRGNPNIEVDVISERSGQELRGFIQDSLRDLDFAGRKYRLKIELTYVEKPFAYATDGTAKRIRSTYSADVVLKDEKGAVVFQRTVSVSFGSNVANAQGEVILSLYGRNNKAALRELAERIVESVKVFMTHESGI